MKNTLFYQLLIGFIILLCSLISYGTTSNNSNNTNSQGKMSFKIVDIKNGNEIHNADIKFIIPELNKEYNLYEHKQISIPCLIYIKDYVIKSTHLQ